MRELTLRVRPASLAFAAVTAAALLAGLSYVRASGAPTATPLAIEGTLTDAAGRPASGLWNFSAFVFDAASGGTARATCALPGTTVTAGRFTLQFAASSPCVAVFRDVNNTWVELEATDGTQTVRTARAQVHAVPYALEADHAMSASAAVGALDTRLDDEHRRLVRWEDNRITRANILQRDGVVSFQYASNVAGVTRIGPGAVRVDFRCPFASPNYVVALTGTNGGAILKWESNTPTSVTVLASAIRLDGGVLTFPGFTDNIDISFMAVGQLAACPTCTP